MGKGTYFGADPVGIGLSIGVICCWPQHWRETFLSALCLVNQWLESYQIFLDTKKGHNKELISFGDLNLIFKVTAVEKLKILWMGRRKGGRLFSLKTLLLIFLLLH